MAHAIFGEQHGYRVTRGIPQPFVHSKLDSAKAWELEVSNESLGTHTHMSTNY